MDWNDTKSILMELELLFNRDDDLRDIDDIIKMQKEIELHYSNSLKDAKDIIKEMTNQNTIIEKDVLAPSEVVHNLKLDKYLAEKENINKQVDKIRCDINEKRQSTFDITAECLKLKQQVAECAERNAVSETRTSYALSLYKKISGINWDYVDSPSKLSGNIAYDQREEVRHFDLDTSSLSSFELANSIWNLIGDGI